MANDWTVHAHVDRYDADQVSWAQARTGSDSLSGDIMARLTGPASSTADVHGNLLLTAGLNRLMSLLTGAGGQTMTATSTRLGVGNSATAEAAGQTDLQAPAGATNRWFQVMDATYPQLAGGVITLKSTFGVNDANFTWNEWGADIGMPTVTNGTTVNPLLFNRKVVSLNVKASGALWAFTVTLTMA